MRLGALNPQDPFSGVTTPVNIEYSKNRVGQIIESSRNLYTKKWQKEKSIKEQQSINTQRNRASHTSGILP